MGDPRAASGFGQVDLDLEDDLNGAMPRPASSPTPSSGFGELDFDPPEDDPVPPSQSRVFGPEKTKNVNTRATVRKHSSVHDESTRIVSGDALSHITRPPPAMEEDGHTRAWDEIDA